MVRDIFLIFYLILMLFGPGLAIECWREEEERMPLYDDCHKIVDALALTARNPEENLLKTWGFFLDDTRQTVRLPKGYYIFNPLTRRWNECGLKVDAITQDPTATGHFRLEDVAWAAHRVLTICLQPARKEKSFRALDAILVCSIECGSDSYIALEPEQYHFTTRRPTLHS